MPRREQAPSPEAEYARSAEQLLTVLGHQEGASVAGERFFRVEWDAAVPTKLTNLTVMTARASGARAQERWGDFHQAQFVITEVPLEGEPSERFVWYQTGAQRPGVTPRPDPDMLHRDFGYQPLAASVVVDTLVGRSRKLENYITLTDLMRQHRIDPTRGLTSGVDALIRSFAASNFDEQHQLFALLKNMQELDSGLPRVLQSLLVSQLLRRLGQAHDSSMPAVQITARGAATALDAAMAEGIIDDDRRNHARIFGSSKFIYSYPFANDRLHALLQAQPDYGNAYFIFGIRRLVFAANYIEAITSTRLSLGIVNELRMAGMRRYRDDHSWGRVFSFINNLAEHVERPDKPIPRAQSPVLSDVGPTFAGILAALSRNDQQASHNQQYVEILEAIIAPYTKAMLGTKAVSEDVDIDLSSIPDESHEI